MTTCPDTESDHQYRYGLPPPSPPVDGLAPIVIRVQVHYLLEEWRWSPESGWADARRALAGVSGRLAGEGAVVRHQMALGGGGLAATPEYLQTLARHSPFQLTLAGVHWTPTTESPSALSPHRWRSRQYLDRQATRAPELYAEDPTRLTIWVVEGGTTVAGLPLEPRHPLHGIVCTLEAWRSAGELRADGVLDHHLGHYLGLGHRSPTEHPTNIMLVEGPRITWLQAQVEEMVRHLLHYYPSLDQPPPSPAELASLADREQQDLLSSPPARVTPVAPYHRPSSTLANDDRRRAPRDHPAPVGPRLPRATARR